VSPRARVLAFGSCGALAVVGTVCVVLISGVVGDVLAIGLISLGLGGALLLAFLEVGLSEDRAREREEERIRQRVERERRRLRLPRRPRRPG
jgi:hypothetical protein